VSRASVTADALISWARDRMAAYKVPRLVEFVDVLPRSSTGKVDWRRLQDAERARAGPPP
jgi:fatty-acyl-CoA synthase